MSSHVRPSITVIRPVLRRGYGVEDSQGPRCETRTFPRHQPRSLVTL